MQNGGSGQNRDEASIGCHSAASSWTCPTNGHASDETLRIKACKVTMLTCPQLGQSQACSGSGGRAQGRELPTCRVAMAWHDGQVMRTGWGGIVMALYSASPVPTSTAAPIIETGRRISPRYSASPANYPHFLTAQLAEDGRRSSRPNAGRGAGTGGRPPIGSGRPYLPSDSACAMVVAAPFAPSDRRTVHPTEIWDIFGAAENEVPSF